jgi:hypothetical protein
MTLYPISTIIYLRLANQVSLVIASTAIPLVIRDMTDEQINSLSWTTFQKLLSSKKLVPA